MQRAPNSYATAEPERVHRKQCDLFCDRGGNRSLKLSMAIQRDERAECDGDKFAPDQRTGEQRWKLHCRGKQYRGGDYKPGRGADGARAARPEHYEPTRESIGLVGSGCELYGGSFGDTAIDLS